MRLINNALYVLYQFLYYLQIVIPNGILVILDNYLFSDDQILKNATQGKLDIGMLSVVNAKEESKAAASNTSFVESVLEVLSFLKSGVRVFQHFLSRSNVSHLLIEGKWSNYKMQLDNYPT